MNTIISVRAVLLTTVAILLAPNAMQDASAAPYWVNSNGEIVRTGYGECWGTSEATAANVPAECGGKEKAKPQPESIPVVTVFGDQDKDGIKDNVDQCPDTASGVMVNAQGCSTADTDGDRIIDSQDDCPNTVKGTAVNNRGCDLKESIDLSNIEFATGTAKLSAKSQSELDRIAMVLVRNDHLSFEVAGHTDLMGNYQRNLRLSQQRAESVRNYLVKQGVDADRLTAKGYGSDKPIADNDRLAGRAMNRRVELVLK